MDTIISIPGSADLLEQVDFSYPTLCRDLNELERENKIVRFHGGVRYADENINALTPHPFACSDYYLYQTRQKLNLPEKQAIGRTAASLVQNNNIVFISHGTTTVELVKALANFISIDQITTLVTDWMVDPAHIRKMEELHLNYLIAPKLAAE